MAGLFTIQSLYTPYQMGHDQTYVGIMIAKDGNPDLYKRDFVFHDDTFYGNYIPAFRFFLRQLIQLTGSYEKALLSLVPPLVFIYALGMGLSVISVFAVHRYYLGIDLSSHNLPSSALRRNLGRGWCGIYAGPNYHDGICSFGS